MAKRAVEQLGVASLDEEGVQGIEVCGQSFVKPRAVYNLYAAALARGLPGGALAAAPSEHGVGARGAVASRSTARAQGVAQQPAGEGAAAVAQVGAGVIDGPAGLGGLAQHPRKGGVCDGPAGEGAAVVAQLGAGMIDGPAGLGELAQHLREGERCASPLTRLQAGPSAIGSPARGMSIVARLGAPAHKLNSWPP